MITMPHGGFLTLLEGLSVCVCVCVCARARACICALMFVG